VIICISFVLDLGL